MTPAVRTTLTANAAELVYGFASSVVDRPEAFGRQLRFHVRPNSKLTPEQVAARLVGKGIGPAHVEGDWIVAEELPGEVAAPYELVMLDDGPYTPEANEQGHVVLRRRNGVGIERIELLDVGSDDEEWRRFLARDVDLIPSVRPTFRRYLAEVPSVHLVKYQAPVTLGFVFQMRHGPFADKRLRRAVALGINRSSVGRAALGSGDAAVAVQESAPTARTLLEEVRGGGVVKSVRLIFHSTQTENQRAALVLEEQLIELGLSVELEPVSTSMVNEVFKDGDFDMFLTYVGTTPNYFRKILGNSASIGYASPDFEDAVNRSDARSAAEILERDVPVTPIVDTAPIVAVDQRFCGVYPVSVDDLSWLADVHLCLPGERQ